MYMLKNTDGLKKKKKKKKKQKGWNQATGDDVTVSHKKPGIGKRTQSKYQG